MKSWYLIPIRDPHRSFYKKAVVIKRDNGNLDLQSYGTIVATRLPDHRLIFKGWFSATTARHINEFLYQYAHETRISKKALESYGDSGLSVAVCDLI